ncbi:MAG: hypothetical protein A2Z78_02035 [Candidatus Nealsonbacteria bacterium RBG_13_36_15]|uniref:Ribose-phosphate pyrophosphokinase N-terminal domain-containing protein n=1 Tax=Candidatus Nealsonbacteria bacterium RBG_13_36_15 TaxID=1801660 RepID=A0A1G2DVI2_9BACT|nr:MAG: hypothetical protein A2Z78_02035 [Candidatus Nealsonbacteria bacterium RBG_13_36_15]
MTTSLPVKVFATSGSNGLATRICESLQFRLPSGIQPGGRLTLAQHEVTTFSNENSVVQVENVRDHFVVVIHTQVPPVSEGLIELLNLLDAIKNAKSETILLVFPYMPYSRSDQKNRPRISAMGVLLPRILTASPLGGRGGVENILLLDAHDPHLKHYFDPAADEVTAIYLLVDFLQREVFSVRPKENSVVVFSDAGAVKRYATIPHILSLPEAYIAKERPDDKESPTLKRVVGKVRDRDCMLFDDEILSGGTILGDAELLLSEGARSVIALVVHPILADKNLVSTNELIQKLERSPIEQFVVTDSVPISHKLGNAKKFTVISVAGLLAEAIKRAILGQSLTELYKPEAVPFYRI